MSHGGSEKHPFRGREISLSPAHKLLVSPQVLLVVFIFLLRVLEADRRPVNSEYIEKYSTALVNFIPEQWRNKYLHFFFFPSSDTQDEVSKY